MTRSHGHGHASFLFIPRHADLRRPAALLLLPLLPEAVAHGHGHARCGICFRGVLVIKVVETSSFRYDGGVARVEDGLLLFTWTNLDDCEALPYLVTSCFLRGNVYCSVTSKKSLSS